VKFYGLFFQKDSLPERDIYVSLKPADLLYQRRTGFISLYLSFSPPFLASGFSHACFRLVV